MDTVPETPADITTSPTFIPLTLEQLNQGLDEVTTQRLSEALNFDPLFKTLVRLGLEAEAKAKPQEADKAGTEMPPDLSVSA